MSFNALLLWPNCRPCLNTIWALSKSSSFYFQEEDETFEAEQQTTNVEGAPKSSELASGATEIAPEKPNLTTLVPMTPTEPSIVAQRTTFLSPQESPAIVAGTSKSPRQASYDHEAIVQQRPITLEKIELEERMVTGGSRHRTATKRRRPPLSRCVSFVAQTDVRGLGQFFLVYTLLCLIFICFTKIIMFI